jgi:hypothetical protein
MALRKLDFIVDPNGEGKNSWGKKKLRKDLLEVNFKAI